MKKGKKYVAALQKVDPTKLYSIEEAVKLVKETSTVKFDATVDVSFKLNVDPKQANQQVRGTLVLPHGNGKTKKVLAITDRVEEATNAGADLVGGAEMIDKIAGGWFDFEAVVATPNMMPLLGKVARLLGPKGLMPNPKTGTVNPDIARAIKDIKAGKVEYRTDKEANMHVSIARVSFDETKIAENLHALVDAIIKARPAAVKGTYIKNAVIHTTMGPAIHFTFNGR
ncbi:50S ribosomal protein L1 [uncultured Streptococcus sp.]|uniref:50S ribosomal protein L1 n=1 Tax=uncultured Streptococcus sp. TaxID=83427 RepID=UPI00258B6CF1|nr:50S ribosomal protein L1 [uncultured Streptococcus sp.]